MVGVRWTAPAAALIAALTGCAAVGPDYHLPPQALLNAPAAQGAFVSGHDATSQDTPLPDHWWTLFDDPRLNALVERALAANIDLKVAEANLRRTAALLDEARTRDFDGLADAETYWTQQSPEQVLQHVRPHQHQIFNIGAGISYDLDLFGGIRRGIEAATDDAGAATAARDLVRINVAARTAQAYAELCNAGHQIELVRELIAVRGSEVSLHHVLVSQGRLPGYEEQRRQGELADSQARLPQLTALQRNAAIRLAALQGQPPGDADPQLLDCHQPLQLPALLPTGDGAAMLRRRPDVRAAERSLAAATARVGVSTAALYPDIKLGAAIGSTGGVTDAFGPLTDRFNVGPMVNWDLRRSAVRARIAQSEASAQGKLAAFDATVLRALREVETALNNYDAVLARRADLTRAAAAATQVAARARELRDGGRLGALPALTAQRDSIAARQALAAIDAEVNAAQVAVFLALGGGWT